MECFPKKGMESIPKKCIINKQTECGIEYSNKSECGMEYIPEIFGMYKLWDKASKSNLAEHYSYRAILSQFQNGDQIFWTTSEEKETRKIFYAVITNQ